MHSVITKEYATKMSHRQIDSLVERFRRDLRRIGVRLSDIWFLNHGVIMAERNKRITNLLNECRIIHEDMEASTEP